MIKDHLDVTRLKGYGRGPEWPSPHHHHHLPHHHLPHHPPIHDQQVVQEALEVAQQGRTSITIAHRLSTIMESDR